MSRRTSSTAVWLTISDLLARAGLDAAQRRQQADQGGHRRLVGRVNVAERKLGVVRVEHAHAAGLVLERKGLRLEFDPVVAGDLRADVHVGTLLQIGMAKLEDDLRIAHREPVDVLGPPAQDEGVVVEPEVGRIEEENFSDARLRLLEGLAREIDAGLLGGPLHQPGEVVEAVDRREAVTLEDDLGFDVLNVVQRVPVAVPPLLVRGPRSRRGFARRYRHAAPPAEKVTTGSRLALAVEISCAAAPETRPRKARSLSWP